MSTTSSDPEQFQTDDDSTINKEVASDRLVFSDFPEGPLPVDFGDKYESMFLQEKVDVQILLEDFPERVAKWYELQEIKIGLLLDAAKTLASALCKLYLKSFFIKGALDDLALDDLLRINNWKFMRDAMGAVIPLLLITLISFFEPQQFLWKDCDTVPSGSSIWDPDSFTESCGDVPVNLFIDDFPHRPAISNSEPDSTDCDGIASNIANNSYRNWAGLSQLVIYIILLLIACSLIKREEEEKRFLKVALHLKGVFLPIEDQLKYLTVLKKNQHHFSHYLPYAERYGPPLLGLWFFLTIAIYRTSTQKWFIFPTKDEQEAFMNQYDEHTGWCNALSEPVKLIYSRPPIIFDWIALAEIVLFRGIYDLSESQSAIYDWIDADSYMDVNGKCPYSNIHLYRHRIFNELMLTDWMVVYVELPVWKRILSASDFSDFRKILGEKKTAELQKLCDAVEKKLPETI